MDYEVACIDITPLTENSANAEYCVIGLWTDISVRLLRLPNLECIFTEELVGGIQLIRSIEMFLSAERIFYLLEFKSSAVLLNI